MFDVFGFYKFKKLTSLKKNKILLQDFLIKKNIRGTIIIASEGVNATISGKASDLKSTITKIKKILDFKNFDSENISNSKFDMVFIDADKMNYKEYYEKSLKLMDEGGLIIVDNVLWHGEVADEDNLDKFTVNIRDFNTYVANDKRVEQIIVPLGDGMTVCRVI